MKQPEISADLQVVGLPEESTLMSCAPILLGAGVQEYA
jgi:hypothetical protein